MLADVVYALCALTSAACTVLLARAYLQTRQGVLLWSALGFAGLTLNNVLLFVDKIALPSTDLSTMRTIPALIGLAVLCYGLIWDADV